MLLEFIVQLTDTNVQESVGKLCGYVRLIKTQVSQIHISTRHMRIRISATSHMRIRISATSHMRIRISATSHMRIRISATSPACSEQGSPRNLLPKHPLHTPPLKG